MNNRGLFTPSQWQELEHQALIFKYLMAGIPVPPDLLLPIRKSLEARIFHHPAMGWGPFYGKKLDPEPGRCRRTDGKKWRCSKDAYPDSKYCERHMHRGRNRSRKPVETQTVSQSSQTVTSLAAAGSSSFQNLPLHSISGSQGSGPGLSASEVQVQHGPYGTSNKDCRYLPSIKDEIHGHSFFSEASGSSRGVGMGSSLDSSWHLMPSRVNSFPPTKPRNGSLLQSNYPHLQALEDVGSSSLASALSKEHQQQQHCFLGSSNYGTGESIKVIREPESQPLRPFFDEWPKTRDSWSDLEDNRSNRTSFSTTQLSISIPMSSSDFSGTSSRSPNDD
ncbi:growth-regulating factor 4-like [Nymphaea colorata]|nr:growth-regulating factor 4-like [Nymphaea colorata]